MAPKRRENSNDDIFQSMKWCCLSPAIYLLTITAFDNAVADLDWNSLADYLKTFENELGDATTTERPVPNSRFLFTNLIQNNPYFNISKPDIPPLLSMFPGSPPVQNHSFEDVGSPLLLTPYIEDNRIEEAREASKVSLKELNDIAPSYTGYFTVDKQFNSNIFFWYIPAKVSNF